jgi:hypothetical protein
MARSPVVKDQPTHIAILILGLLGLALAGRAQAPPEMPVDVGAQRVARIPHLSHPRGDRWPLLLWGNGPEPGEKLQAYLDRGFCPVFNSLLGKEETIRKELLPRLRQLRENNFPLVILPQGHTQAMFMGPRVRNHLPPEAGRKVNHRFDCPAWLSANPHLAGHGESLRRKCEFLRREGFSLDAVFIDFESGAYLRNGAEAEKPLRAAMAEAAKCALCQKVLGKEAMASPEAFAAIVDRGRAHAIRTTLSDPVHSVFPEARTGNFYAYPVGRLPKTPGMYPAHGYDGSGMSVPQPRKYFTAGWLGAGGDEREVAWACLGDALRQFSPVAETLRSDEMLIPWLGNVNSRNAIREKRGHLFCPSTGYAEIVRHMMLRGAETFALFVPHSPASEYPEDYRVPYRERGPWLMVLQGVQAGYADMLRFNDFLRRAKPVTFSHPPSHKKIDADAFAWSGMATEDIALVRTITYRPAEHREGIALFGGKVSLPFTTHGAFYWVQRDRTVEEVR